MLPDPLEVPARLVILVPQEPLELLVLLGPLEVPARLVILVPRVPQALPDLLDLLEVPAPRELQELLVLLVSAVLQVLRDH